MVLKKIAKDSAIYGFSDFISKVLAFFIFPVIAAVFSPETYGVLELILTATGFLGLAMQCGLNNAVQRFYWDKEVESSTRPAIVTTGFVTQFSFGLLVLVLGMLVLPFVLPMTNEAGWPITWIALVGALVVMVFTQWTQYVLDVLRLHFARLRFVALALSSRLSVLLASLVSVVWLGYGLDGLLAAQALVLTLFLPVGLLMIRKDFNLKSLSSDWSRKLVGFGYPFIFAGLAYWLFGSMDRWMLASMSSIEEVGIYSVSFRFSSIVFFVSVAFGQAWSPLAIKIRTDHPESYRKIYGQVLLLLLFVMLIVGGGVALFSGETIGLVMPKEYHASAIPLSVLCFGIILQATQQVTAIGISIEKKTFLLARLAWLTAFVNLAGNYLLVPRYGATGAACATLISYAVLTFSYLFFTQRLHPLQMEWRRLMALLLMGCAVATVSIYHMSIEINSFILLIKISFAITCILVGWRLLPLKRIEVSTP